MENNHNFYLPRTNLIGVGSIKDLPNELLPMKLSKALIVTDKNIISLGYAEQVEKILDNLFIAHDIFDGIVHPNPTVSFVEDGLTYCDQGLLDFTIDYSMLISIGGGSNHDCAKAIAAVATNGGSIIDYEGWNKVAKPIIPLICVNTTAGSGAELTMTAIITDNTRKVKMTVASPLMTPWISVNDPLFMGSMPREVTASSGIDVACHAIEAFFSTESSPTTDALCLGALEIVFEYLPRAYENGYDLEAREKMMYANFMAASAFNSAGLGYVHAMAHQLGGHYNTAHGSNNTVLMPHVLEYNAPAIPEPRLIKICESLGKSVRSRTEALAALIDSFKELSSSVGLPGSLVEMGARYEDIETMAQNALKDIVSLNNPRKGTLEDVIGIYERAM